MYPDSCLPSSICPLFWKVLIGFLATLISPGIVLVGIIRKFMKLPFYTHDRYDDTQLWHQFWIDKIVIFAWFSVTVLATRNDVFHWYNIFIFPFIVVSGISLVILFVYLDEYISDYRYKNRKTIKIDKKPSVIKEGLKAWWNKVCPLIEYED